MNYKNTVSGLKRILASLNTEDLTNSQRIELLKLNIKMLESKINFI